MAKPDDTRIAPAPQNASTGSTPASSITDTPPPLPHKISRANAALIRLLEGLIHNLKTTHTPVPPKHARTKRIRPRHRVTVRSKPNPAAEAHIPRIHLCGNWLIPAGFPLHTRICVHVGKDCMILLPEREAEPPKAE